MRPRSEAMAKPTSANFTISAGNMVVIEPGSGVVFQFDGAATLLEAVYDAIEQDESNPYCQELLTRGTAQ